MFLTSHPVEEFAADMERCRVTPVLELPRADAEREIGVCGIVANHRVIKTKKGDKMAFATLEDTGGAVECVFFPEAYKASAAALGQDQPIYLRGKLEKKEDGVKILADTAELMDTVRERATHRVEIVVQSPTFDEDRSRILLGVLEGNAGRCDGVLVVEEPGVHRTRLSGYSKPIRVAANARLINDLRDKFGVDVEVRFR